MDIYETVTRFYESVDTEKRVYGFSESGRNLYAIKLGQGKPVGIAQYAIHGREYITAYLAMEQYFFENIKGSIWILPLTNPDGCLLSQCGLDSVAEKKRRLELLAWNDGNTDFSLWKANVRGVDLNVNFQANWGQGRKNIRYPAKENYIGTHPFSERESKALKILTLQIKPDYTISYHTKGEEIYWYFHQPIRDCPRDKRLATALSESTGYPLAYASGSVGGYKDWCIQKLKIPSFTVEVGKDTLTHPLQEDALEDIFRCNLRSLRDLSFEYGKES